MTLIIEEKFANIVGLQLEGFKVKRKTPYLANFRCPICGDSEKKKNKMRGYFYCYKDALMMRCHNCGASMGIASFLKMQDGSLYKEYNFEKFQYNNDYRWNKKKLAKKEGNVEDALSKMDSKPKFKATPDGLTKLTDLPPDHKAIKYIEDRQIPKNKWNLLYYTDNYVKWVVDYINKDKFKKTPQLDQRIVIPFYDKDNNLYAYQGRAIYKTDARYITINESDQPLVYGEERIDLNKPVYVVEGPFDSLFLDNCLAVGSSALGKVFSMDCDKTFIYDNEPRSKIICDLIQKTISKQGKIVIWPTTAFIKNKDINDFVKDIGIEKLKNIIDNNVYSGIEAQLIFDKWKKV